MESLDLRAHLANLDPLDLLDLVVNLDNLDLKANVESLALEENKVICGLFSVDQKNFFKYILMSQSIQNVRSSGS